MLPYALPLPATNQPLPTTLQPLALPYSYFNKATTSQATDADSIKLNHPWLRKLFDEAKQAWVQRSFYVRQLSHPMPCVGLLALPKQLPISVFITKQTEQRGWLVDATGQRRGKVFANGDTRLEGQAGVWDFYNNPFLQPNYISLKKTGPLGRALLNTAFERSLQHNMAPYLRSQYPTLSGAGQSVAVIDFDPDHLNNLASILLSPQYGIAPEASLQPHLFTKQTPNLGINTLTTAPKPTTLPTSMQGLQRHIANEFIGDLDTIVQPLQALAASGQPAPLVLMLSLTMERKLDATTLEQEVLLPALRQAAQPKVLGGDLAWAAQCQQLLAGSPLQRQQRLQQLVLASLNTSPELHQHVQTYQQATQALAKQGTLILVAAGNANNQLNTQGAADKAALFNLLAASPDVLVVGGSDMQGTPTTVQDDKLAAFSNPAVAQDAWLQRTHVDFLAPAVLLPIDGAFLNHPNEQAFNNGTSLAVPLVAGLLCLMKEANPALTSAQLKGLLLASCANPNHLSPLLVGAGFLDPLMALQLASGEKTPL